MAGHKPLVAIITRTKDRPLLLRRALLSVRNQSYQNYIHVVVNDGGGDYSVIEELISETGSRAMIVNRNSGGRMEMTSNEGIKAAMTYAIRPVDLVTIHDDDDSWSPEFLTIMINELHRYEEILPSVKGIICRENLVYEKIEGNIITIDHIDAQSQQPPFEETGIVKFLDVLDSHHNFSPIQFLYKAEVYDRIGMYDPMYKVLGDWEFNLRFLRHFDIALIPDYLAFYHQRVTAAGPEANSIHEVERKLQWECYRQHIANKYLREENSVIGLLMNPPKDSFTPVLQEGLNKILWDQHNVRTYLKKKGKHEK
jgi:glycosyltransferase involved in cell wall biosynthesis